MQTAEEVGKYVTDGKKVYPYNAHLDDMIKRGQLTYCERPVGVKNSPKPVFRSPVNYTPDERLAFAQKLGITLGELTNYSPQEFETAMQQLENPAPATEGFPS